MSSLILVASSLRSIRTTVAAVAVVLLIAALVFLISVVVIGGVHGSDALSAGVRWQGVRWQNGVGAG